MSASAPLEDFDRWQKWSPSTISAKSCHSPAFNQVDLALGQERLPLDLAEFT
jgi:hypothetical protein